jgi:hypothetical protein
MSANQSMKDDTVSAQQEVGQYSWNRPHVVLLGAGASRATCPAGDKHQKVLPLMADFAEAIGIRTLLERLGLHPWNNFEELFSDLWARNQVGALKEIEGAIETYFRSLELPDIPTIYDYLVLSLRSQDLIATFNWDPLLILAYRRSLSAGLSLPRLAFLHGNVGVGYCAKDRVSGMAGLRCRHCKQPYERTRLLYPIKQKNYSSDPFIADAWRLLKWHLEDAFMITIFGYSGPKTDQEAISAMDAAWGGSHQRDMEQTAFIIGPNDSEKDLRDHWDRFVFSHHYEVQKGFYDSWIARHPRRTGEAYRTNASMRNLLKTIRYPD